MFEKKNYITVYNWIFERVVNSNFKVKGWMYLLTLGCYANVLIPIFVAFIFGLELVLHILIFYSIWCRYYECRFDTYYEVFMWISVILTNACFLARTCDLVLEKKRWDVEVWEMKTFTKRRNENTFGKWKFYLLYK